MRPRRVIRERPPAQHNGEPAAEFVELAPDELSGVFAAPTWLRDLGMMSWLLVGVAALAVGVAVLLLLANTVVPPGVTPAVIAPGVSPPLGPPGPRPPPPAPAPPPRFLRV